MSRKMSIILIIVWVCTFTAKATSFVVKPCGKEMLSRLNEDSGKLHTWNQVFVWYKNYACCDDHSGSHAEDINDAVVQLLSRKWNSLPELTRLSQKDKRFETFVLSYINSSANEADLLQAASNAQMNCPRGAREMCKAIKTASDEALQEVLSTSQ